MVLALSQAECGLALSNALFVNPIHDGYRFAHSVGSIQ